MNARTATAPATPAPTLLTDTGAHPAPEQTPAAGDLPSASGADLARIMLRRAKADAKNRPVISKPKTRQRSHPRGDGRDPNPLGGIIKQLVVDNQWERGKAGGNLKNAWPSLVGEAQAAHWKADAYDEQTGILRVICDSPAWAASLRLMAPQMITKINGKVPGKPLRGLDVQTRTGHTSRDHAEDTTTPSTASAPAPVLRKERGAEPSNEYLATRAALRETAAQRAAAAPAPAQPTTAAPRREPDEHFPQTQPDLPSPQAVRAARNAVTHARALARARTERSQNTTGPAPLTYLYAS